MRQFRSKASVALAAALALGMSCAGALSQSGATPKATATSDASEPDNTSETFGDWVARCVRTEGGGRVCELSQTLEVKGQGVVAQIAVGRAAAKAPYLASVLLPINVSFPSTVQLALDEKDDSALELPWKQCVPAGCLAQVEVKEEFIRKWRAQTGRGQIRFTPASRQPTTFVFSFRGFAGALDALGKLAAKANDQ